WTQLASQTSAVSFDVYNRERTELIGNFTVGTLIDTVWKDDATNSLIFGTYFQLDNNTNGITEINSIVRSGFAEFDTVAAAWTFADSVYDGVAGGYRLRDPSRSDYVATYNATAAGNGDYLDLDKVAIRTDVSLAEGNPNSGLYLLRVDATGYTYAMSDDVVRIVQGASSSEGGRIFQDTHLAGYVAVPVPEPSEYALMLIGLAGVGFSVRRRQQRR
ncbi:MAG: PEP-CTERM sorting domain-containing protein, partial [Burkholderiales bacterium]|nr:PEP-CTERM sorting domain-containing protein [Burkholderiales bacterium]